MAHAYVFGFLGARCKANARTTWNALLKKEGIDGFFDFYRTTGSQDLATRLSEMFLLERRGYLIDVPLQEATVPLMDFLAPSVQNGRVDVVKNERGVLTGHYVGETTPETILKMWMT